MMTCAKNLLGAEIANLVEKLAKITRVRESRIFIVPRAPPQ